MTRKTSVRQSTRSFSKSRVAILLVLSLVVTSYYLSQHLPATPGGVGTANVSTTSSITISTGTGSLIVTANSSTTETTTFQSTREIYNISQSALLGWLNKSDVHIVKSSTQVPYYIVAENESHATTELLYLTTDVAMDSSYGYNGPISVLVLVNTTGYIKQLSVWHMVDSWGYMITQNWLNTLVNRTVFGRMQVGADVQGVTGATISSSGIINGIRDAGQTVLNDYYSKLPESSNVASGLATASDSRSNDTVTPVLSERESPLAAAALATSSLLTVFPGNTANAFAEMSLKSRLSLLALVVLIASAVVAFELKEPRLRYGVLVGSIAFIGFYAVRMVTIGDIISFLTLTFPPIWNSNFWYWYALYATVLVTSLVWGRFYCGYLCPFGGFTEILNKISPIKLEVPKRIHDKLRYTKYIFLGAVILGAVGGVLYLQLEPFGTFFLLSGGTLAWVFLLSLLALSIPLNRPYCSYVCPIGAGLSLLAWFRVREIRRWPECKKCMVCANQCPSLAIKANRISVLECMNCRACEVNYSDTSICPHYALQRAGRASQAA